MKSEEILQWAERVSKLSGEHASYDPQVGQVLILAEIAYQLAIANESAQESRAKSKPVVQFCSDCHRPIMRGSATCTLCGGLPKFDSKDISPAKDHSGLYQACSIAIAALRENECPRSADALEAELKKVGGL